MFPMDRWVQSPNSFDVINRQSVDSVVVCSPPTNSDLHQTVTWSVQETRFDFCTDLIFRL